MLRVDPGQQPNTTQCLTPSGPGDRVGRVKVEKLTSKNSLISEGMKWGKKTHATVVKRQLLTTCPASLWATALED